MSEIAIAGLRYRVTHFDLSDVKLKVAEVAHGVKYLELVEKCNGVYLFRLRLDDGEKKCKLLGPGGVRLRLRSGETLSVEESHMRRLVNEGTFKLIRDEPAMKYNPKSGEFS